MPQQDIRVQMAQVISDRLHPINPLVVDMEDEPIHTATNPYCNDSTCPCQQARREQAPLNGTRPFSFWR